jgi:hypothetical protein
MFSTDARKALCRALIHHRCNEPVSSLGHGFDKFRFIRPVAEDFSDVQNVFSDQFWVDIDRGPELFQKFALGDQPLRIFDQVTQQVVGFRGMATRSCPRQRHWFAVSYQGGTPGRISFSGPDSFGWRKVSLLEHELE